MKFTTSATLLGVAVIIAGILVLAWPDVFRWIMGVFLIIWGTLVVAGRR